MTKDTGEWMAEAACAALNPSDFDAPSDTSARTCAGCPVQRECVRHAMHPFGRSIDSGDADEAQRLLAAGVSPDAVAALVRGPSRTERPVGKRGPSRSSHPEPGRKTCSRCGDTLPLHEFPSDRSRWDGLNARCRVCCHELYRATRGAA